MPVSEARSSSTQAYWDTAAETYDRDFAGTLVGKTRRYAVWRDLGRVFRPDQRILELNCGTGIDAVHLAKQGVRVLACDISPRMIELARQLASVTKVSQRIDFRVLGTENIDVLESEGPFDGAFSNFSGLNCVEDLSAVVRHLAHLLKPGAPVLISMMGRFVPWEIVWFLAHGDGAKAIWRLRRNHGCLKMGPLTIQHPSVKEIARMFAPKFTLRRWKGIGIAVPPSYMEHWARRFPKLIEALARVYGWAGGFPLFRNMADQVFFEFERKETQGGR